jgi:hypothetical protein
VDTLAISCHLASEGPRERFPDIFENERNPSTFNSRYRHCACHGEYPSATVNARPNPCRERQSPPSSFSTLMWQAFAKARSRDSPQIYEFQPTLKAAPPSRPAP